MRRNFALTTTLVTALFLFGSPPSEAASLGLDSSGGTAAQPVQNQTLGWSFTLSQPRALTALGIWDQGSNGLIESHPVAIWTSSGGSPLASVTVTTSGTPQSSAEASGRWLFQALASPIVLPAGDYVLGANYAAASSDFVRRNNLNVSDVTITTDPVITYTGYRFLSPVAVGIQFPNATSTDQGVFGPNLLIDPVPEPAALGFLTIAGLLLSRRPRRQTA